MQEPGSPSTEGTGSITQVPQPVDTPSIGGAPTTSEQGPSAMEKPQGYIYGANDLPKEAPTATVSQTGDIPATPDQAGNLSTVPSTEATPPTPGQDLPVAGIPGTETLGDKSPEVPSTKQPQVEVPQPLSTPPTSETASVPPSLTGTTPMTGETQSQFPTTTVDSPSINTETQSGTTQPDMGATPAQEAVPTVPSPTDTPVSTDAIATPPPSDASQESSAPPDQSAETPVAATSDTPAADTLPAEVQASPDTSADAPTEAASPANTPDTAASTDTTTEELQPTQPSAEDASQPDLRDIRNEVQSDPKNEPLEEAKITKDILEAYEALDIVKAMPEVAAKKIVNEIWQKKGVIVEEYLLEVGDDVYTIVDSRQSPGGRISKENGGGFAPDQGVTITRYHKVKKEDIDEKGRIVSESVTWLLNPGEQKRVLYTDMEERYMALFLDPNTGKIRGDGGLLASNDTHTEQTGTKLLKALQSSVSSSNASPLPGAA